MESSIGKQQQSGNRLLATVGYLLWQGGFVGLCVTVLMMIASKPMLVGQNWALVWFGALAISGLILIRINRKVLRIPVRGMKLLGSVLAQLGVVLSSGLIFWLRDTTWGGWWLGIAFLIGSVALFSIGTLLAANMSGKDVGWQRS